MQRLTKSLLGLKNHKYLCVALACAAAIAFLSLTTNNRLPKVDVHFFDKIGHFVAYGVLAICWSYYFLKETTLQSFKKRPFLAAFLLCCLYGALMEVLQGTITQGRTADLWDMLANTLGAFLGISLLFAYRSFVKN